MRTHRVNTSTREILLDAADRIVVRDGASTLTLDAVAHEAGVSKGGVLYHFATKDALVRAMLERAETRMEDRLQTRLTQLPPAPGRWTRAYLAASLSDDAEVAEGAVITEQTTTANAGLLAAVATNPRNLDPLRAHYANRQAQIEVDGIEPAIGTLIRLAIDGLWLSEMLDLAPPDARTRSELSVLLHDLIERGKDNAP